ncbi:MAG: lipoyl(octanoyl) transferase LipB [Gemmatimonadales bacterium]|nr:lipoyl(octanoyl) transferase LipB [Gemmatimonadales bacterium]MYL06728.1 lipoyl(octanoyl) transferase LipB [Gemmatimonadales bacterium]
MNGERQLRVVDLGRREYREVLELQRSIARWRRTSPPDHDLLLLVEHLPVITFGRGSRGDVTPPDPAWLAEAGLDLVEIERGGDLTYHGPGQLVGYPILDLRAHRKDLHWYLRRIEEVLLRVLAECGLPAFRVASYTGVWTGSPPAGSLETIEEDGFGTVAAGRAEALIGAGAIRKVASIGVHASRWITSHGFALNVTPEPLMNFRMIVACGIHGVRMTSLASEGASITLEEAAEAAVRAFPAAFPILAPSPAPEAGLRV